MPACLECDLPLERKARGPFPLYCSPAHRQRAYARRKKTRDATARVTIPCPWCAFTVEAEYLVGPYVMSLGEEENVVKLVVHAQEAHSRLL